MLFLILFYKENHDTNKKYIHKIFLQSNNQNNNFKAHQSNYLLKKDYKTKYKNLFDNLKEKKQAE